MLVAEFAIDACFGNFSGVIRKFVRERLLRLLIVSYSYYAPTIPPRKPNSVPKPMQVVIAGPATNSPFGLMLTLLQSKEKS